MKENVVQRLPVVLKPSHSRVLVRPFLPGSEERAIKIISRVMALPAGEVNRLLVDVLADFADRHPHIKKVLLRHYDHVRRLMFTDRKISEERRMLIGAYFTQEYALESAALFNPSIVPHPDQSDAGEGNVRAVISLRATGEGHISSIVFRMATVDSGGGCDPRSANPVRYPAGTNPQPDVRQGNVRAQAARAGP